MGTEARGNTRHRETKSDITPPLEGASSRHTPSNVEGGLLWALWNGQVLEWTL